MKQFISFAAIVLTASAVFAGEITTTLVPSAGTTNTGILVFDMMISNTDNWVGTDLILNTFSGVEVHQEKAFGVVHVNGLAPQSFLDAGFIEPLDTFFVYPGIVRQAAAETMPGVQPAPLNQPSSDGTELKMGWFHTGNNLKGLYKIAQIALDGAPVLDPITHAWGINEDPLNAVAQFDIVSRVKTGESITKEIKTLYLKQEAIPEPTSALLALLCTFGIVPFVRRRK